MIIVPVEETKSGRTMLMIWVTPDAIARLQAGQACELVSDACARRCGVAGVIIRPAADDAAAAAAAQRLMPKDVTAKFEIVMVDRTTKADPR